MPLLGKIVVIKRNGEDGTEFPLTASCLFGRKLNCDIRIQLPQVSKEHCKIELNENKELILTNLSSVNPTCVNGEVLQQSERLKHGDLITIIDRSFRFEYPPPKTPKKRRLSTTGNDKTPQLEKSTPVPVEKRKSEHLFDTCLKDGTNLPQSAEQTVETAADEKLKKDSLSPFGELYQMVKQDLAAKSPWKSGLPKTPLARPQVDHEKPTADVKSGPIPVTTPSTKKRRSSKGKFEDNPGLDGSQSINNGGLDEKSVDVPSVESSTPSVLEKRGTPVSQKRRTPSKTPEKFSPGEVVQQILLETQPDEKTSKSQKIRRSGVSQDQSFQISSDEPQTPVPEVKNTVKVSPRTSPRTNAGKRFQVQDVLNEIKTATMADDKDTGKETHTDVSILKSKRKRVSFGGQLSPELFDKRLPPDSPLRRGATPRRSLGLYEKSQSLLRRASTIGLMAFRLEKTVPESTKAQSSPAKKASPKRASGTKTPSPARKSPAKTPSPARRSPAKTLSPKSQKSPGAVKASTPGTPKTPASSRRASTSVNEAVANGSVIETPRVQGRFSISRISTPSPVQDQVDEGKTDVADVKDTPQESKTPKIPLRRKSMKSARKTPKSAIKSALDVMRSRRSGASRANLKVLNSWADIVKFGQTKPQMEVTTKNKATKSSVVKKTAVPKPKTPACRLKDAVSTGHAASPATIVVGKAHLRTIQCVGAVPKIVPNMALFKRDMKMDEDMTGVADIFKTPANSKTKSMVPVNNLCPETTFDELSVMKTPEETGEMIVSPLSMVSTAKHECFNNEAVTRLLLDNQDGSLLDEGGLSQTTDPQEPVEMPQTEEEENVPETPVRTLKLAAAPSLCLTGVKRLMKTPKHKAEPIEDLRGKLLKTPKAPKQPQEESLQGVKELLKTPKHRGVPVEDMVGVKRVMQTPKEKNNPVLCAAGLQKLMKTPKEKSKVEHQEDLTGLKELMKTPKHKGQPVEDEMGVKRLMQTPNEKVEPLEDLIGVRQLIKTPKQKSEAVKNQFDIGKLIKTPQQKQVTVEKDLEGLKELIEEPENTFASQNVVIEPVTTHEPVPAVENDSALMPSEDFEKEGDKEIICPVEPMETEDVKSVDPQYISEAVDVHLTTEAVISQTEEESILLQVTDVCTSALHENTKEQSGETVCSSDNSSVTAEQEVEEEIKSSVASRPQRGGRGRQAQKSKAPAVKSLIKECAPPLSSPARGRRAKKLSEVPEIAATPVRKSVRGKVTKPCSEDKEAKDTVTITTEVSDCPPAGTKTKRGRKAQKDEAEIEPVQDAPDVETQSSDAPVGKVESIQAPVPKAGRRRMNHKMESQTSEEHHQTTEIVCEENAVAADVVSLLTSEAPITVTKTKRGRPEKTKTEPSPTLESDTTSNHVSIVAEKSAVAKSGRGRVSKKEAAKEQTSDDDPKVDGQEEPEAPAVKSGRGRKSKLQIDNQATVDDVVTEEMEVKSVRRGRPTKQSKEKVEKTIVSMDEQTDVPVIKSMRKRPVETVADVPVKRGRRAVVDPTPSVVVVSSRGRRAVVKKSEKEITQDIASSEEQVLSIKQTRRMAKVPEANKNLNTELVASESIAAENTAPEKVARGGTRGKKENVSAKDNPKNLTDESTEEVAVTKTSKTVVWSTDLVTSKDIEEFEPPANVKEEQLKTSNKSDKSSAKISTESDQSTDKPSRGRRGRVARKEEEPSVQNCPEETKPLRRGMTVPKSDAKNSKTSTPLKRKRNETLEVNDDPVDKEPLPKRRGRIASNSEVVAREEKTTEAAPKTNAKRTARGPSKMTQEPAPAPAQEIITGISIRRGRSVKKEDNVSTDAAPVRRTRRK